MDRSLSNNGTEEVLIKAMQGNVLLTATDVEWLDFCQMCNNVIKYNSL